MRSSVYSLVLTFFTFVLILPIIDAVGSVAKFKPWFTVTFASGISLFVFQDPYPTDKVFSTTTLGGANAGTQTMLAQYYPAIQLSLIVMAAYFFVALVLAIIVARRREM
jgi:Na+-transporting methylmalonyl-CoA/oxaloacetate decarboxylase beta subunit